MQVDDEIRALARRQSGLFTSRQALGLGFTSDQLRQRTRRGEYRLLARHVYVLAAMPTPERVLLHAALLEASGRSAVSHASAAAHWGFPGFSLAPFHLSRLRDGTFEPTTLGTVHTTRRLLDSHIVDADGLLLTTPTRTLFDLARTVGAERTERLLDRALVKRQTTPELLQRTLRELSGKGQSGITVMRDLLSVRLPGYVPAESGLETRFDQVMRERNVHGFERQVEIFDHAGMIGRVDYAHRWRMLLVEIDSALHHTSISDVRRDLVRQARMEALGFRIERVSEHDVWHSPAELGQRICDAILAAPYRDPLPGVPHTQRSFRSGWDEPSPVTFDPSQKAS